MNDNRTISTLPISALAVFFIACGLPQSAVAGETEDAVTGFCAQQTGAEPMATTTCAVTLLALVEAGKCVITKLSDCVGQNNTLRVIVEKPEEALDDLGDSLNKRLGTKIF